MTAKNTLSLDGAREKASAKYSDLAVDLGSGETVTLLSALKLSKAARQRYNGLQARLKDTQGDEEAAVSVLMDMIRAVADDAELAEKLVSVLEEEPLSTTMVILEEYGKVSQVGEA